MNIVGMVELWWWAHWNLHSVDSTQLIDSTQMLKQTISLHETDLSLLTWNK